MPHYTSKIPDPQNGPSLPIRRTPASTKMVAIVTSEDLIGTYTHYWKGRTVPCETPNCEPCNENSPFRWHAYFACLDTKSSLHFIFETTAAGAERFVEYRDHHGTLRGCLFQAQRWMQRINGRILIQTKPADLTEMRIPDPPDMRKYLAVLWNLNGSKVTPGSHDPARKMSGLDVKSD